ncbi:MAG: GGDEF domain-containing protein [Gammaproteobacteria bacterium]|nr:GGDEF domain-containing protein [Gammaproteobacteria bacterium]
MTINAITNNNRRNTTERRSQHDRRDSVLTQNPAFRVPGWRDQQIQYALRLIILVLGVLYFNLWETNTPLWMSLDTLNIYFITHGALTLSCYIHATTHKISLTRFRIAVLIDVIGVSIASLNDPASIPPCMLAYILVVLGNGMRYGMKMFKESLILCLIAATLVISARFILTGTEYSTGLLYMIIFGFIILLYSYTLMAKLETSRISLEDQSQRDELTGLLNRRALYTNVSNLLKLNTKKPPELVIMFADLDLFKQINDTHGHATGDMVLKNVAEILTQSVRDVDVISRFGGDEFVIIIPNTSISVAEIIAHRIQKSVIEWAEANHFEFNISLGIGEIPRHGNTLSETLKAVDQALYHSKLNHGPGGLCYAVG